jgi:hypothetical protein
MLAFFISRKAGGHSSPQLWILAGEQELEYVNNQLWRTCGGESEDGN